MSLLRCSSSLLERILTNNVRCSVQIQKHRSFASDSATGSSTYFEFNKNKEESKRQHPYFAHDPPPGYDYTHLEGPDQVGLLSTDEVLTPEKRAALAAKYNLRPEDYIPLNEKDLNLGDYPKLPYEHCLERDPYYDWDDRYFRRNYGEPIHHEMDVMQPLFGIDSRPPPHDQTQMKKYFFFWFFTFIALFMLGQKYPYFPPKAPKQYPETHPMDGRRPASYEHDYIENRGTPYAKLLERKQVVNYTFPEGLTPSAH